MVDKNKYSIFLYFFIVEYYITLQILDTIYNSNLTRYGKL